MTCLATSHWVNSASNVTVSPLRGSQGQELADSAQLTGRIRHGLLAEHERTLLATGTQQVHIVCPQATCSPQRFAVDGDAIQPAARTLAPGRADLNEPLAQTPLHFGHAHLVQQAVQGGQ
jgi:hypothetical protein